MKKSTRPKPLATITVTIDPDELRARVEYFARQIANETVASYGRRRAVADAANGLQEFLPDQRSALYQGEILDRLAHRIACEALEGYETGLAEKIKETRFEKDRAALRARLEQFDSESRARWLKDSALSKKGTTRSAAAFSDEALLHFQPLSDQLLNFWQVVMRGSLDSLWSARAVKHLKNIDARFYGHARVLIKAIAAGSIPKPYNQPKRLAMKHAFLHLQDAGLLPGIPGKR